MDVQDPGKSKPETGSKPMVVGHKFLAADPDVKLTDPDDQEKVDKNDNNKIETTKKKIVLEPISDNIKTDEEKSTPEAAKPNEVNEETEQKQQITETSPDQKQGHEINTSSDTKTSDEQDVAKEKAEESHAKEEKEERLKEIIKSKEYYVPIKRQGRSSTITFLMTFVFVCLLGVVVLAALIDAEILDLGVDLPFDLL